MSQLLHLHDIGHQQPVSSDQQGQEDNDTVIFRPPHTFSGKHEAPPGSAGGLLCLFNGNQDLPLLFTKAGTVGADSPTHTTQPYLYLLGYGSPGLVQGDHAWKQP
jgi:hypothetical protein